MNDLPERIWALECMDGNHWGECTELGFCPELGYADEDWCPWCKTRMLLGLPIARNMRS
jgi:hypothetical protein